MWAGHTWVIEDFTSLHLDDKNVPPAGRQNKGHTAAVTAFCEALSGDGRGTETAALIATARSTLLAAVDLRMLTLRGGSRILCS